MRRIFQIQYTLKTITEFDDTFSFVFHPSGPVFGSSGLSVE